MPIAFCNNYATIRKFARYDTQKHFYVGRIKARCQSGGKFVAGFKSFRAEIG